MGLNVNNQLAGGAIFYSQLAKVIEGAPARMSNLSGGQWAAWLAGNAAKFGVKQAEMEWTGILDWLALQLGKVPKEGVLGYLEGNGVRVEETVLGEKITGLPVGWTVEQDKYKNWQVLNEKNVPVTTPQRSRESALSAMPARVSPTRYETYTLPGGENYREVLLTLPVKDGGPAKFGVMHENKVLNVFDTKEVAQDFIDRNVAFYNNGLQIEPMGNVALKSAYKSSHWDQANVLAHIRVNDRVDVDGKKVLFVEEIQSDWAAEGRKKGFKQPANAKAPTVTGEAFTVKEFLGNQGADGQDRLDPLPQAFLSSNNAMRAELGEAALKPSDMLYSLLEDGKRVMVTDTLRGSMADMIAKRQARINANVAFDLREAEVRNARRIPLAPFVTKTDSWLNLALKRVIKMAVDGDYDRVAFVSGGQSAERYDLSKQISKIDYEPTDDGLYELVAYDLNGKDVIDEAEISIDRVEELVGKEVAVKIKAREGNKSVDGYRNWHTLSGINLEIGGEGMKAFYDQIVPNVVKDVVKKLGGGAVESVNLGDEAVLPNGWSLKKEYGEYVALDNHGECQFIGYSEQHVLDSIGETGSLGEQVGFTVTEKMRDLVLGNGVPLFQDSRGVFDASTLTVTLLDSADESTFIHEAGHFYLEVLTDLAGQPSAPVSIAQDVEAVMDWLGVPGGVDAWKKMPMAQKTPFHEQFARGVEAYFMTGVAPAPQLEGMFSRFAKFLAGIYKSVTGLDVALTPEITSVFDRLVVGSSLEDRVGMDVVQEGLASQLAEVDRFPAELNAAYAGMVANFYGAVAGAVGVSVVELAAKYPLEIRSDVHGLVPGGVEKVGVESEAFKEWFGDSKVVRMDGAPLAVYHGTDAVDVHVFDGLESVGWFAENPAFASKYASACRSGIDMENTNESGPNVLPVFLSIKNPLRLSFDMNDKAVETSSTLEYIGLSIKNFQQAFFAYEGIDNSEFIAAAKKSGFDGVVVDERGAQTWSPFENTQIKSVFNRGSWDRADPAILHQSACVPESSVLRFSLDGGGQSASKIAKAGEFSGPVLDVSANGVVTQRVNRAGDVVRHDAGQLSAPVAKGDVAHIKYANGVGMVSVRGVGVDVGR